MTSRYTKLLVLTALFAGLAYVANLFMLILPNVSLAFYFVFLAGYTMGMRWGAISGALSFFLISYLNPYGMALPPLLLTQIICGAGVGFCGGIAGRWTPAKSGIWGNYLIYALWGIVASIIYMGGVSLMDAYLFGPFKERLLLSLGFSMLTIISNLIIFPILSPLLKTIREMAERI